jgi:beta-glucosidase
VLAREAAAASAVVLVDRGALPIPDGADILAAGAVDDIGIACGGWTISWSGAAGPVTEGRTILDGLRRLSTGSVRYDAGGRFEGARARFGVVALHELPYVEGGGDRADLAVPDDQIEVVRRVREVVDQLIVVVISGRPLLIEDVVGLADAVVACWLPGSEADGIAEVLLGRVAPSGRLPVAWPRSHAQVTTGEGSHTDPSPWPAGFSAGTVPALSRTGGE